MTHRNPRWSAIPLAFLLILLTLSGLATTVTTAWLYAGMHHPWSEPYNRFSTWSEWNSGWRNGWGVREWRGTGKRTHLIYPAKQNEFNPEYDTLDALPAWNRATSNAEPGEPWVQYDARGWPFLALRCTWPLDQDPMCDPRDLVDGGIVVSAFDYKWLFDPPPGVTRMAQPDWFFVQMEERKALPLVPIWSGLAASTAFWAGVWVIPVLAFKCPGTLRRRLRRRRGRCQKCGYDLRGLRGDVCPECGRTRTDRFPLIGRAVIGFSVCVLIANIGVTAAVGVALVRRYDRPSPLHVAAATGNVQAVESRIAAGADINQPLVSNEHIYWGLKGTTPLMWAARAGRSQTAKLLLNHGAAPEATDDNGRFAIMFAAQSGDAQTTRLLLDAGNDARWVHESGNAVVGLAAGAESSGALNEVLGHVDELPQNHAHGWSPRALTDATRMGRIANLEILLRHIAPVRTASLTAPLEVAVRMGHVRIARLLLEQGAPTHTKGRPHLWTAAEHGHTEIGLLLLEHDSDPNVELGGQLFEGWTALRRAILKSNEELATALVLAGADPHTQTKEGDTLLFDIRWDTAPDALVELVFSFELDVNHQNNNGSTPLMDAAFHRDQRAVVRLLAAGADPLLEDNKGQSSLDFAREPLPYLSSIGQFQGRDPDQDIVTIIEKAIRDGQ